MTEIGVILNEKQEIASLLDGTKLIIFEKKEIGWKETREIVEPFRQRDSIPLMRELIKKIILEMRDCKIIVASILTGIPFLMLDKAGFMLCEAKDFSDQLFEEIYYDYAQMEQEKEKTTKSVKKDYPKIPVETKEAGIFELDLRKLQENHPEISSKMAILPFLKKNNFYQLNLFCDHVMPWLEHHPIMARYEYRANKLEGSGYLVCIAKPTCTK